MCNARMVDKLAARTAQLKPQHGSSALCGTHSAPSELCYNTVVAYGAEMDERSESLIGVQCLLYVGVRVWF